MQTTFGVNLLALTDQKPKVMSLKEMITEFIRHRKEVVKRRTAFDLKKAEEKAHILEGLIIALDNIDRVIALIKRSKSAEEARTGLMASYKLTQVQSQAILDMKLQRLTSLEQGKIREEHSSILELIRMLKEILGSEQMVMDIIRKETDEIAEKYGDDRKTQILEVDEEDIDIEDLIDPEDMVVTISHSGYVKRIPLETYKEQKRGGKGIIGTTTKEEDFVEHLFIANTHDYILFFTNLGRVHWLKVYKLPEAGRYTAGKAIVNVLDLPKEEHVTAYIKIKEFDDKHYLVMATRKGVVKKTNLDAFSRPRAGGIIAITLDEGDSLIKVALTDGEKHVMLATRNGLAVRFKEIDVRSIGRSGRGVRGISLRDGDEVVSMMITEENNSLLTITENGYGKRTKVTDYRLINRGGVGVRNIICSDRNGKVVDVKEVTDEDQVLFISKNGVIIRTATKYISTIGRNTQGMRLMRLTDGDNVVAAAQVVTSDDDIPEEKPLETQPEDNGIIPEEELDDIPPTDEELDAVDEEPQEKPVKKPIVSKDEYI
jgi:DNA gyrase subunit A